MQTEFEATFSIESKDVIRKQLKSIGAKMVKEEFKQTRAVFNLPTGHEIENGWLRVRDEQDKVTMSLKVVKNNTTIANQKEIELRVNSFDDASALLTAIGCKAKSYQENLRERWELGDVEITIDEWPFLDPYIEIEGSSEEQVREVAEQLGYDWKEAYFGSVDYIYAQKYGVPEDTVNNHTPEIKFDMDNPFL
ncbi:class IV adenylate cyclase [Candidatus Dojkabacteria bacterium]|uniref:Class IV adenylate cyclase n=1 Tax=Candidatus Dojkabacteria bacterium TaxID=2099670 RepID=A0A955L0D3_9BACT|nr:class IV adenylate cyclase [Candidatus Dojkabacteria bacterium]